MHGVLSHQIFSSRYLSIVPCIERGYSRMIYVALVILMFCLVIGVPVPLSFMASSAWLIFFGGPDGMGYQATQLLPYGFAQINSVSLMAVAMFIMAGGIMERGRI